MNKRIHVYYNGRVQGVGFRFTARSLASGLNLTGWVKNLPDGRVELLCEGEEKDLHKILDRIDEMLSTYILEKKVDWLPATGKFKNFEIRFF